MSSSLRLAACALLVLSATAPADEVQRVAVGTHSFEVTVDPVGENRRDASRADLFYTRFLGAAWQMVGPCQKHDTPQGPRFTRAVTVPGDGVYYFTSRAGDEAGMHEPPKADDPAQVEIVVDTMRPVLAMDAPLGHEVLQVGRTVPIRWSAQDANFGPRPISLHYSDDYGQTWCAIGEKLANSGREIWTVPATEARQMLIRITAVDDAGNATVATTVKPLQVLAAGEMPAPTSLAAGDPLLSRPAEAMPPLPEEQTIAKQPAAAPAPEHPEAEQGAPAAETPAPAPADRKSATPDHAWMNANRADLTDAPWKRFTSSHAAYLAWIYAGNLVRQGRLPDALRYLQTAVREDQRFDEAWNDAALIYKDLNDFERALSANRQALAVEPDEPHYLHTRGEIFQTRFHTTGLPRLKEGYALGIEEADAARQDVQEAVTWYGRAIAEAERRGQLADRAASYFRLGEIAYYANHDPVGARQYWFKVLELHTPTPELDDVMLDAGTPLAAASRERYETLTHRRVQLETWQAWAQTYLDQLAAYERQMYLQAAPSPGQPQPSELRPPTLSPLAPEERAPVPVPPRLSVRPLTPETGEDAAPQETTSQPATPWTSPQPAPEGKYLQPSYGSSLSHKDYVPTAPLAPEVVNPPPPPSMRDPEESLPPSERSIFSLFGRRRGKSQQFSDWPMQKTNQTRWSDADGSLPPADDWQGYQRRK